MALVSPRLNHDHAEQPRSTLQVIDSFVSGPANLLRQSVAQGSRPAYFTLSADGWVSTSWSRYGQEVRQAAAALIQLGVTRGDRVAILGFNRPEWAIMAFGAMALGATPVGIYWTSSSQDIEHILHHSAAKVLLLEKAEHLDKVMATRPSPHLLHTVFMKGVSASGHHLSWDEFLSFGQGRPELQGMVDAAIAAIRPEDTGTLIYTSGTTGPAKAVSLSHRSLSWTVQALMTALGSGPDDRALSYLPYAHIAEQLACLHAQAHVGFSVHYARSMEELGEHLKGVRPSVFFGVPRVWEKMQAGIEAKLHEASGVKAMLAHWSMTVARRWHETTLEGSTPGPWQQVQMKLARRLVLDRIKAALGLDAARMLSSGAAPIAPEKLQFFLGLDLVIREVYGQSETCGPATLNLPGATRIGSVGRALPGTEVRIAGDGEVLIRGPHVFQGYADNPEATAEARTGEWLRTGDLGRMDREGYLYITGRKKDLIITSGGKNISPGNIEAALMDERIIEHAVVCGDGRHYLVALLTLDPQGLALLAEQHHLAPEVLTDGRHPVVTQVLQQAIDRVNGTQAKVAHVRKFAVLQAGLSVEQGELTPTLKVKRKVVIERHRALIDTLYSN